MSNEGRAAGLLAQFADQEPELLADLESLVRSESPSSDVAAVHRCAELVAALAASRGCGPAVVEQTGGGPVVRIGPADAAVVLLGHLDTVHPVGSLDRNPWRVDGGRAYGPGVFDMKSGLVIAIHAMAAAGADRSLACLITADEEIGSPWSLPFIEATARAAAAVLVVEPSEAGALKTARKGVSSYVLNFHGRAAHAGLEPEKGANACVALAEFVLAASRLSDGRVGTTVTPTVACAGSAANVVPDTAELRIDARAASITEQTRIDKDIRRLAASSSTVPIDVTGGPNRPPLESKVSVGLFRRACTAAARIGLPAPTGVAVGGGSDGNLTAALGVPTLDGLGAVGAGAHTLQEWVAVASLPQRAALLTALIEELDDVQDHSN